MRPQLKLRKSRPAQLAVAAVMMAIPTSAVALSAGAADAHSALQVTFDRQTIGYGQRLTATGTAPRSQAGHELLLELAPYGRTWQPIGSAIVHSNGRFRIFGVPKQSGSVKVVAATGSPRMPAARDTSSSASEVGSSQPRALVVSASLQPATTSANAVGGQPADVRGTLLPRQAGRVVVLESRVGGTWHALVRGRTRANGHFELRYSPTGSGPQTIRVYFAGDPLNGATSTTPGQLAVYRQTVASWYDDGGSTACGFHATFGVASRDLPCGTKVGFFYAGRTVTAVVDDRGPYVGGRDWDLNQGTAAALGFGGVDTVWSSR
ncbi:MAG: RlpA-like double-psi beta-barrel domain-containing protein [Acidimicrobiia bacterium]|nr:RlpA-like double-psi beta-barrel domain-containing protein [Acidimicrobiia bacterium]